MDCFLALPLDGATRAVLRAIGTGEHDPRMVAWCVRTLVNANATARVEIGADVCALAREAVAAPNLLRWWVDAYRLRVELAPLSTTELDWLVQHTARRIDSPEAFELLAVRLAVPTARIRRSTH